jgi:hypothetical protein
VHSTAIGRELIVECDLGFLIYDVVTKLLNEPPIPQHILLRLILLTDLGEIIISGDVGINI